MRSLTLALVTAMLLTGCGGDRDDGYETRGTASGMTTYAVASEHFSVAVPEAWRTLSADHPDLQQAISETPSLEPYAELLTGSDSILKFVAVDPDVAAGFATNLNIGVERIPVTDTLDTYSRAFIEQLRTLPTLRGPIRQERLSLPAGPAARASYRLELFTSGTTRTVSTLQYVVVRDGAAYVLTYTTLPELSSRRQAEFLRSARTFELG